MRTTTKSSITLGVTHPEFAAGPIQGFQFFWAYYVTGYWSDRQCQPCFKGKSVDHFCTPTARSGQPVVFDLMQRYKYLYICGVGTGPRKELGGKNFHWVLEYQEGNAVDQSTYNGYVLTAQNAVARPIPPLPPGWNGLKLEQTRCKNFQFAVDAFGYPSP
jgi:hypothetical protein